MIWTAAPSANATVTGALARASLQFYKAAELRWQFGVPPNGNANFAWVQHFIHHLAPQGMAGFVLANGSISFMPRR